MEKRFDELSVGEAFEYIDYCGNLRICEKLKDGNLKFRNVDFKVNAIDSNREYLLVPDSVTVKKI